MNLLFFLPAAAVALCIHLRRGQVDWRMALRCLPFGAVFALLGAWLARVLDAAWLSKGFCRARAAHGAARAFGRARPVPIGKGKGERIERGRERCRFCRSQKKRRRRWAGIALTSFWSPGMPTSNHPTFGPAIISRVLESHGYPCGDARSAGLAVDKDFIRFGKPRLGFMVKRGQH